MLIWTQTAFKHLCVHFSVFQVGIVLHYASLSTMLWLTFTARNICKDVSKDPLQTQGSNRSAQAPTKLTILR